MATFGPRYADVVEALYRDALSEIAAICPWERPPEGVILAAVCNACIVFAALEQVFRGGPVVQMIWFDLLEAADGDLVALRASLASGATRKDLRALASACVPEHLWCRASVVAYPNPHFALSVALGGADADLVIDGELLVSASTFAVAPAVGKLPVGRFEFAEIRQVTRAAGDALEGDEVAK